MVEDQYEMFLRPNALGALYGFSLGEFVFFSCVWPHILVTWENSVRDYW